MDGGIWMVTPEQLKARRLDLGLTLAQAAKITGISKGHLWKIENRGRNNALKPIKPRYSTLIQIAKSLGMEESDVQENAKDATTPMRAE